MTVSLAQVGAVAVGGAFGASFRFLMASATHQWLGRDFPYGTLAVNILGSLLIGYALVAFTASESASPMLRLLLITGVLGGFTTYSAFSLETLQLAQQGRLGHAALNIAATVVACLLATWGGLLIGRAAHGIQ